MRRVRIDPVFEGWRDAARSLLQEGAAPADVLWEDGSQEELLPNLLPLWKPGPAPRGTLPKKFLAIAARVAAHRDRSRWDLLYRVAFRLRFENRHLLEVFVDDDVHRLSELDQSVRRDIHKMHAFVRFRKVADRYLAWYAPDHHIVPLAAPFFVERFRTMSWAILTPDASAHWDGSALTIGAGVPRVEAPTSDELETLWRTYYASMFNPARLNLRKMRADMPARFWRDMPELRELPRLLTDAPARVESMIDTQRSALSAGKFVPETTDIETLRETARNCQGCALYQSATQTVFGEGPRDAEVVLVGEQPGDREDLTGRPFVGPAGQVLDRALAAAGLDRGRLYLTNAVKHFAYIERGKARIHRQPRTIEIAACRPWLEAELRTLDSAPIVCLGSTAARALLGGRIQVLRDRGQWFRTRDGRETLVTIHPSAVLRADPALREEYFAMLASDLALVASRVQHPALVTAT